MSVRFPRWPCCGRVTCHELVPALHHSAPNRVAPLLEAGIADLLLDGSLDLREGRMRMGRSWWLDGPAPASSPSRPPSSRVPVAPSAPSFPRLPSVRAPEGAVRLFDSAGWRGRMRPIDPSLLPATEGRCGQQALASPVEPAGVSGRATPASVSSSVVTTSGPDTSGCCCNADAYWLLDTLPRWLSQLGVARMRLDTLRIHRNGAIHAAAMYLTVVCVHAGRHEYVGKTLTVVQYR